MLLIIVKKKREIQRIENMKNRFENKYTVEFQRSMFIVIITNKIKVQNKCTYIKG